MGDPLPAHSGRIPHRTSYDVVMAVVILALGALLAFIGLNNRWAGSAATRGNSWSPDATVDVLVGSAALWAGVTVVAWWALSMAMAFASAGLLVLGRTRPATRLGRFSPAFMQRIALAVLGLNLAVLPAAQASVDPGPAQAAQSIPGSDSLAPFLLGIQDPHRDGQTGLTPPAAPGPGKATGEAPAPGDPGSALDPSWTPSPSSTPPGPLARVPLRTPSHPVPQRTEVEVRPGDSLWSIVKRQLGPQATDIEIALAWPRWYDHNRDRIGPEPDLVLPGTVLVVPPEAAP